MVKDTITLVNIKEILDKGLEPSKKSKMFLSALGPENISTGLKSGLLRIICNKDNTFEVSITEELLSDIEAVLKRNLKQRGYQLTLKGEKFIRDNYIQNKIFQESTK